MGYLKNRQPATKLKHKLAIATFSLHNRGYNIIRSFKDVNKLSLLSVAFRH